MANILVVIPAYNESESIGKIIKSLPSSIKGKIIDIVVIDDGSTDTTAQIVKKMGITCIRHMINRGLGAALSTGFEYSKMRIFDIVITFDADGQHNAKDLPALLEPILSSRADVVIGSRLKNVSTMPISRKIVNYLSNIATWLLFGVFTTDSQSGLRAFNKFALTKIKIKSQRMEVSSEIFNEIRRGNLRFVEVPIQSVYTEYSLRKGQSLTNAPNVLWKLMLHKFK